MEERRPARNRGALQRRRALSISPSDEPLVGPAAIADSWLDDPDRPGSFDASYDCFACDGDAAVAIGTSTYFGTDGDVDRVYGNVFALRFDAGGRCCDLTEWYVKRP